MAEEDFSHVLDSPDWDILLAESQAHEVYHPHVTREIRNENYQHHKRTVEVYDKNYKDPSWVQGQWTKVAVPKPKKLKAPDRIKTGSAEATVIRPLPPPKPDHDPVYQLTAQSEVDIADLGLEELAKKAVSSFKSGSFRYFKDNGIPQSTKEATTKAPKAATNGLDVAGPPMSNIYDIFDDMAGTAERLGFCGRVLPRELRIFTMCSGTEAPLLAMNLMQQALERRGKNSLPFKHLASVEIQPFKQAFIQRNYNPSILFRDVNEFTSPDDPHTAYGGTAAQPRNVDILIAGTVCVDYSTLNKSRKEFGEDGKSYNTLTGLTSYANRHRPKIIILENVQSAPWLKIRHRLGSIGYEGIAMKVDSKNFYIPQTRARVYLVAFDVRMFGPERFNIVLALEKWTTCMQQFQRRATCPFPDFILPDDDPYLHQAKLGSLTIRSKKRVAWDASRHRYAKCRVETQIGMLRPMTRWQTNGTCVFLDFAWMLWAKRQRERIWDTLDIEFLRHVAERNYDMNYKCRWIDMSQNVDYDLDKLQWGIVGCITPTGLPYFTTRGGPAVGKELLSLQGIPINELDLNRERMSQLQDLAGNAMTTTVVGAAICSAIIAAQFGMRVPNREFFTRRPCKFDGHVWRDSKGRKPHASVLNRSKASDPQHLSYEVARTAPQTHTIETGSIDNVLKSTLLQLAGRTMELCPCEAVPGMKPGIFKICRSCGHTACSICAGNPMHKYEDIASAVVKDRSSPAEFATAISRSLPTALSLNNTESIVAALDHEEGLQDAARLACASPATLRDIKRGRSWKIIYEGSRVFLELHFVRKCNPRASSIDDFFGQDAITCYWLFFAKPDRRLSVSHPLREVLKKPIVRMNKFNALLDGEWQTPHYEKIQLTIQPPAKNANWIRDFNARLGLQHERFRDLETPETQVVHVVSSPNKAANALASTLQGEYSRLPNCGGASGSLHVRVQQQDSQASSPMFFYLDPEQLKNAIEDSYVFADNHHRLGYKETRLTCAKVDAKWRPQTRQSRTPPQPPRNSPVDALVCIWKPHPKVFLGTAMKTSALQVRTPLTLKTFQIQAVDCRDAPPSIMLLQIPLLEDELKEYRGYQYLIPLIGKGAALRQFAWVIKRAVTKLPDTGIWQVFQSERIRLGEPCSNCVPKAPGIEYREVHRTGTTTIAAREKVKEAIEYERTLQNRPPPLLARIHCQSDTAVLDIKVNLPTLIHRVIAKIQVPASINRRDFVLKWRLEVDEGHEIHPAFKLKAIQDNKTEASFPTLPTFFQRALWLEQKQALAWMVRQEMKPCGWEEKEQEEVCIPGLSLRLDVEARVRKSVCGGVLADEVGAGKTTTSLALIAHMLNNHHQFPKDDRTIPLKATLILVPKGLLKQWEGEAENCYGDSDPLDVLIIENTTALVDTPLSRLKKADVIVAPWNIFDEAGYWTNLANLCGARNKPETAGRAFEQWLQQALEDSYNLIERSGGDLTDAVWHSSISSNSDKYGDFETVAQPKRSGKPGFRPLLHLFLFQRLMVDEYSYLEGLSFLATLKLKALSKWMLSGTPSLANFDAVNTTAKLIGTRLSVEDEEDGCFSFVTHGQKLRKDRTDAEEFQVYQNLHSAAWYRARYELADDFVQSFIRKNSPNRVDHIQPGLHLQVNPLSAMEQATYLEVYQRLMSQGTTFQVNYSPETLSGLSRQQRLWASISMSRGPEDALLSCCSDMRDHMRSCNEVVEGKKDDVVDTLQNLYEALREVFGYVSTRNEHEDPEQLNAHFLSYKLRICRNDFGDGSVSALVDMLMHLADRAMMIPQEPFAKGLAAKKGVAKTNHIKGYPGTIAPRPRGITTKQVDAEMKVRKAELKSRAEHLNTTTTRLVDEIRSLRFFENVFRSLKGEHLPRCAKCGVLQGPNTAQIIGTCGHITCKDCLEDPARAQEDPDGCVAPHCIATALQHHIIPASRFSPDSVSLDDEYGSKVAAIINKISEILTNDTQECILVFVQLPRQAEALIEAFNIAGILHTDATGITLSTATAGGPVQEFQNGNGTRVCVLLLESADAAGWNLQRANHVMFVSALVVESQARYNAIMKQAIGRCDRYGQQRQVQIYHFLMAKTVDVNIWQEREHKKVMLKDGVFIAEDFGGVPGDWEGPGLQGAACGAGAVDVGEIHEDEVDEEDVEEESEAESEDEED